MTGKNVIACERAAHAHCFPLLSDAFEGMKTIVMSQKKAFTERMSLLLFELHSTVSDSDPRDRL